MKLLSYRDDNGASRPGAVVAGGYIADLASIGRELGLDIDGVPTALALGAAGRRPITERIEQLAAAPEQALSDGKVLREDQIELLPPSGARPFILGCGGIFVSHLKEMGVDPPIPNPQPDGYIVNPNTVVGSGTPIVLPELAPDQVDFEGELCVVFGRPTYRVTAGEAMDHVAGFTVHNDVSARDLNGGFGSPDAAERVKAYAGVIRYKGFPTFAPLGPCVTTMDELPDIETSRLITTVNGEVMQDDLIGNLAMSIPEVIERVTRIHSFEAGDLMTLGTPAGVGYARDPRVFLRPGDVVEVSVDGIGTLRNPVQAAAQPA
ncbi:fumarylacetoacetate hydrolase family protein [Gordonia sp. PKS22-38]|uniref:Fumarylacetoacetate hydrolase family protein n=1 Tax=Gordonia prachuapensis TaxID=3115651 RepID=A0ABU7MV34_9ACTN|nr:fumarylacetoacetate hydrolase family protein [Gordonia sp. PKS22-38]